MSDPQPATVTFRYRHERTSYAFQVSRPYTEGHLLTPGEAHALNQLRADNIRNNMRDDWEKLTAGREGLVPDLILASMRSLLEAYDLEYQFRTPGQMAPRLGSLELEARKLALAKLDDGATEEEILALAVSIELVTEARERLAARAAIASSTMEDLLR